MDAVKKKVKLQSISAFINKSIGNIEVGPYEIRQLQDGSYWIEHESGEGMQTAANGLIELIDKFYKDNF